jgi:hypothetical protein
LFTNELEQSLEHIVNNNHTIVLDETVFSLGAFSKELKRAHNPSDLDQQQLEDEKKYTSLIRRLTKDKKNLIVVPEVTKGLHKYLDIYNITKGKLKTGKKSKKQKKYSSRQNLVEKIQDDLSIITRRMDSMKMYEFSDYLKLRDIILTLNGNHDIKSGYDGRPHSKNVTDESVVAAAFYNAIFEGKKPVAILSDDSDIPKLLRATYLTLFGSGYDHPALDKPEHSRIVVYGHYGNPNEEFSEKFDTLKGELRHYSLSPEEKSRIGKTISKLSPPKQF